MTGADAIVAQGIEAGGHGSSVAPLMTLLPDVVDLMQAIACEAQAGAPTPVLAAGVAFTMFSLWQTSAPLPTVLT